MNKFLKWTGAAVGIIAVVGLVYYVTIARLPQEEFSQSQILAAYDYQRGYSDFQVVSSTNRSREFTFSGFDGETVYGQLTLPDIGAPPYKVLVGVHAMGRSYPRWFNDAVKGRPTITNVDKITGQALRKGYAVLAIDARYHGKRKVPEKPLRSIWNDMHFFGDKSDYQDMIINTVIDNRTLLDWVEDQSELDANDISVAGYSMGGQISLILGAVDDRIRQVVSIVPPFIDNKIARASPLNLVSLIDQARVLMIYGESDDVATPEQNQKVFEAITSQEKQIDSFPADHILPVEYVERVSNWLR